MVDRYWVAGGTGDWSSTTNWSATTGGASGASVPGSADTATFNASSGAGTATVDSSVTIQTLTMTGFTGTLAYGANTISLNSSGVIFTGGATYNVTGTPVINVISTANATVNPGATTEANSVSFNFTTGGYTLTFLATAGHAAKNVDFTGFTGTWGARNVAVTIYGNLTLATGMTLTASTGVVTLGATSGTQSLTFSGKTFNQINVNGVGGTVFLATNPSFSAAPILTNGTFDFNSRTIGNQTWTMTTGSVVIKNTGTPGWTFNITQSSGTLTLGSDCVVGGTYTLTAGTLDLGGYALTCGLFSSSNSNARTIAFGTGNIVCNNTGGTLWTTATVTGLTITGTPVVNISNSGAVATTVASGILTEAQAISFNFTTGTYVLTFLATASYSARNVDFTGFAGTWGARTAASTIYGNLTLSSAAGFSIAASSGVLTFGATSGTQLITTNGKTIDEPLAANGIGGTVKLADALIMGATRTFSMNNGTFDGDNKTISGAALLASNLAGGTPTIKNISTAVQFTLTNATLLQGGPNTVGAFLYSSGNLNISNYQLTCSTYTATAGVVRTITCGTGNITVINTAGGTICNVSGTSLTRVGNVVVNISNNSSNATVVTTGTLTEANAYSFNFINGNYLLTFLSSNNTQAFNVDFTGFSGTFNSGIAGTAFIYGNLTLSSSPGFIMSAGGSNVALAFSATSGVQTVTSNGASFGRPLNVNGVGGTVRLADAMLMVSTQTFTHTNGTLDLNGKTLTLGTTYATAAGTKNLTFNGGTLVCPAVTTTAFNNAAPTNFTTTAGTGTGKISMTGATAKTFVGGGATYNCTLSNDGAGALTVSGSNTFTTIANGVQPTAFTFTAATTQTVTNWNVSGTAGNLVTIISSTAGVPALLSKASGTVSSDYLSLKDSTATGGAAWYAGTTSTNVSGNLGWIFTAPPATGNSSSFFFMF